MSANASAPPRRRGGLVVRVAGVTKFLPASMTVKVAERPKIARLAGAPPEVLGIALFEGALIPIVTLSTSARSHGESAVAGFEPASQGAPALVVCQHEGERLGLMGLEVLASGTFATSPHDADDGVVLDDGMHASVFDVGELYARLRGLPSGLALPPSVPFSTLRSSP